MTSKITILYESTKHDLSKKLVSELEKHEWQIFSQDLAATNFAKRFWLKFWDGIWLDIVTSSFVGSFPENISNWFRKQLIRPRIKLVLENLRKFQPPIVMVTSFTGGLVMSYLKMKQLYRGKVVFHLDGYSINPLWVLKEVDLYLCNSERQAELLKQRQVDSAKYTVIKPDLDPEFFKQREREETAFELGLLTTMPTILMLTEVDGADVLRESFLKMIRSTKSFQIAVVCKDDSDIKAKLEKITSPVRHPAKFFTQFDNLHQLFAAASVVIGPLNTERLSQAAASKIPVVITDLQLLSQPENFKYLLEQNLVTLGRIPAEVLFLVESILDGRKITNLNAAMEVLAVPKNSLLLSDALVSVNPAANNAKQSDYQKPTR